MDEVSGQGRVNERAGLSDFTVRVMELPEVEVEVDAEVEVEVDAACDESVSGGFTTGIYGVDVVGGGWPTESEQGDDTASSIARP